MAIDKNSVPYMRGYLRHAFEFEKFVYVWSNALNQAQRYKQKIYNEKNNLESIKQSAIHGLSSFDNINDEEKNERMEPAKKYQTKVKRSVACCLISFVILATIFAVGFAQSHSLLDSFFYSILGFSMAPVLVFIVSLIYSIYYWAKIKDIKSRISQFDSPESIRRRKIILQDRLISTENDLINIEKILPLINEKTNYLQNSLDSAKKTLAQIYSKNVLHPKYRNLNAVATMCEYLETGQCNTIQGHGGIYDTYEVEMRHIEVISHLAYIGEKLDEIHDQQRYIYQEICQANHTLQKIYESVKKIEVSSAQSARNSEISALANQQTAANTSWMRYEMWANR